MRKAIAAAAAVLVGAVIVAILKNCIIVSEPHIPGGTALQEHPAAQQEEQREGSDTSVLLGEETLLQIIPEMFSVLGDMQQAEIAISKNTMHISGELPVQGIQAMLQESDDMIAQSEAFLLQQAQKQTVSAEATIICDTTQFSVSGLTVNGLAIPPELCDDKLSDAFQAAFAREAQKLLSEIYAVSIEQDGIHITGAEK